MAYRVISESHDLDAALRRLWGPILPEGWDVGTKLDWYYRANPHRPGKVLLLECDQERAFVGSAGVSPRAVHVNGKRLRGAIMADLGVERAHRTVMPALMLTRAVQRHCRAHHAFSYGFPNELSIGVYNRIGYRHIGKQVRYARVLRHAHYLRSKIPVPIVPAAAGWVLDAPLRMKRWRTSGSLELQWALNADARFDVLWDKAKERYPVIEYRGADYLSWRFFAHPSRRFEVAVLADRAEIRAYAVVEHCRGAASIWDILGESDDHVRMLLDLLAQAMRKKGAHALSIHAVGRHLGGLLVDCGFWARESHKWFVIDVADGVSEEDRRVLVDSDNWYVADGGEDS